MKLKNVAVASNFWNELNKKLSQLEADGTHDASDNISYFINYERNERISYATRVESPLLEKYGNPRTFQPDRRLSSTTS